MLARGFAALLGIKPARRSGPPPAFLIAELPRSRGYCLKGRRPRLKPGQKVRLRHEFHDSGIVEAWSGGRRIGELTRADAAGLRPLLASGLALEATIAEPGAGRGRPIRIAVRMRLS